MDFWCAAKEAVLGLLDNCDRAKQTTRMRVGCVQASQIDFLAHYRRFCLKHYGEREIC
jgi:hypothetical protein